ncbi:hypothetical protein CYMTET_32132 [Cymbomonas tetramitiformis]|uniref:Uncharacterized protein n=1 Tax=Cymbomonas tetramitiformis TaxID=36881 RepID=A0AAE0KS60_9CHLO|nr:hypothetical protein CYMTET_32132 [Cymbomonas tetramitiformis]
MPIAAPVPSHPLGRLLAGTGASSARLVSTAREPPPADQTDVPSEGFRVPPSRDPTEVDQPVPARHPGKPPPPHTESADSKPFTPAFFPAPALDRAPAPISCPLPALPVAHPGWSCPKLPRHPLPGTVAAPHSPPRPCRFAAPPPPPALSVCCTLPPPPQPVSCCHLPSLPAPVGCCTPSPGLSVCCTPGPFPSPNKSPPTSLYFTSSSSRNLRIDPAATPCASCGQDSATEGLYPGQTSAHGVRRNLQDQFLLFDSAHVPAAPPPNPSDSVEPIGSAVSSPPPPAPNTILNRSSASTPAQSPARVSAFSLSENSIYNPSDSPPLTRSPSATPARSWSAAGTPARSPSQAAARSLSGTLARSVSGMQTYENRMYSGLTLKLCAEELPELTSCCILKSITDCAAMCASFFACG